MSTVNPRPGVPRYGFSSIPLQGGENTVVYTCCCFIPRTALVQDGPERGSVDVAGCWELGQEGERGGVPLNFLNLIFNFFL